ncbi:DUF1405 domain-containing protein [Staphylococcus simiae]|uniref:DUF1405 domain-containing protein n=1 Tax=Staphylococcus simiae TaxID=308354 RepID=UPI001A95A2A0|nr:DUF1405 domain-containing protein [Staphylococcus simiae]MBO1197867.1 DUF1405 domain-containing protein [Staphylococcus simiae]MBO1200058.1 DUF1405 domain-containing protein [Staphylococcus simiae]MBO1202331.1 DUF1405 domain-containing protein [Staphylococcus simiae]MBO1209858.1 DUF1405 domain-containing protein [Staphylococcus simiae]MBO1228475.1 DUF1405 domain-containing protein [Staphylococcus simiae]
MTFKELWSLSLYNRTWLLLLLVGNILGTIYGYIWYGSQLQQTPWYFLIFVPDSPTASLFLSISILLMLMNKHNSLIDTLAFIMLVKYGVWAVIMNIILFIVHHDITLTGIMLLLSHAFMALQALYFYPRMTQSTLALGIAIVFVLLNDYIDYVHLQFPYYDFIAHHLWQIGLITVALSLGAILLFINLKNIFKEYMI